MPKYRVTLDGRTFELTGDHPPTEAEAREATGMSAAAAEPQPPSAPTSQKPQGDLGRFGGYKMIGDKIIGMLKSAAAHPIETGAMIGGAAAVPLTGGASLIPALAAAGLGGAGGAGLGMIANALGGEEASPTTARGVLTRMGTEGATQAAAEGGGRAIQGGLKAIASQSYRGALRPSAAIRAKYPNVVKQGIEDSVIVGPGSSAVKARGLMTQSRKAADKLVENVGRARGGVEIPRGEITQELAALTDKADELARVGGTASDAARVQARAGAIQSPSLEEAHNAARLLSEKAEPAFKAARTMGTPLSIESQIDKALASGYSNAVKDRVKGLAEQNALTSTRFGLARALKDAAERPSVLGNLMAGGAGVGTYFGTGDKDKALASYLAMKGLSSPRALSTGAIGLSRVAKAPFANLFRAALLAKLNGDE